MIGSSGTKMWTRNDCGGGSGFWTDSGFHCGSGSGHGYGSARACSGGAWAQVSHGQMTQNGYGHAATDAAWVHLGETRVCESGIVRVVDGAAGWLTG